jgi:Protein of unknown function (DUF3499)
MGRLCERPGCSEVASTAYGFDADRLLVWLAPREPDADRPRAGALCRRHADTLVLPRGWSLDDRREAVPRLFPWTADFDVTDDLGGVLAADTPLLARAFLGAGGAGRARERQLQTARAARRWGSGAQPPDGRGAARRA